MESRDRAVKALSKALSQLNPAARIDSKGYVADVETNLIAPMSEGAEADFGQGAGHELKTKMTAAHSSSALACNVFDPWRTNAKTLALCGQSDFTELRFEWPLPSGLKGTPPHLDVAAKSQSTTIAIESKCLEYFTPKQPSFSDSYRTIEDDRAQSRWFRHVLGTAGTFAHLDAGQLVKHFFGLAHSGGDKTIVLLYLYWEPLNWKDVPECVEHRAEIQRFAYGVARESVGFAALSYPELWDEWEREGTVQAAHLAGLRERYAVEI